MQNEELLVLHTIFSGATAPPPLEMFTQSFLSPPQGHPSEARKLLPGRTGWRMKFKDTSFGLLLLSLPSGAALQNHILYPCPFQKPSIFQDTWICPHSSPGPFPPNIPIPPPTRTYPSWTLPHWRFAQGLREGLKGGLLLRPLPKQDILVLRTFLSELGCFERSSIQAQDPEET